MTHQSEFTNQLWNGLQKIFKQQKKALESDKTYKAFNYKTKNLIKAGKQ